MATAVAADDYYAILEVSQFATSECIRESYKRLALRFHPDKNRDHGATERFQRLMTAWETLRDARRRGEYDRTYVRSRRGRVDVNADEAAAWRRSWEAKRSAHGRTASDAGDWTALRKKVQAWKSMARDDYLARLRIWQDFRRERIPIVLEFQETVLRQENELGGLMAEDYESIVQQFQDAINRSSSQAQHERESVLAKLLDARRTHITRLEEHAAQSRNQLTDLMTVLENDTRRYEEEAFKVRTHRIRRALGFLDPRGLDTPLFSPIERRGQAINCWKALSRVKPATKFATSLHLDEGPWHVSGKWERVTGEQTCGRCDAIVHDLMGRCGPSKCPSCGMIACFGCLRTLLLLQEYERWVTFPTETSGESLLAIVFDPVNEYGVPYSFGSAAGSHRSRGSEGVHGYHL